MHSPNLLVPVPRVCPTPDYVHVRSPPGPAPLYHSAVALVAYISPVIVPRPSLASRVVNDTQLGLLLEQTTLLGFPKRVKCDLTLH